MLKLILKSVPSSFQNKSASKESFLSPANRSNENGAIEYLTLPWEFTSIKSLK